MDVHTQVIAAVTQQAAEHSATIVHLRHVVASYVEVDGVPQVFQHPTHGTSLRVFRSDGRIIWIPVPERFMQP